MDGAAKFAGAKTADADFFSRAKARLTLDVPHGLADPNIIPKRGDHDADPVMEAIAKVRPIRPAAVLIPVIARAEPMVLLTTRTAHLQRPRRTDRVSRRQDRCGRREPGGGGLARSAGRDRA